MVRTVVFVVVERTKKDTFLAEKVTLKSHLFCEAWARFEGSVSKKVDSILCFKGYSLKYETQNVLHSSAMFCTRAVRTYSVYVYQYATGGNVLCDLMSRRTGCCQALYNDSIGSNVDMCAMYSVTWCPEELGAAKLCSMTTLEAMYTCARCTLWPDVQKNWVLPSLSLTHSYSALVSKETRSMHLFLKR